MPPSGKICVSLETSQHTCFLRPPVSILQVSGVSIEQFLVVDIPDGVIIGLLIKLGS